MSHMSPDSSLTQMILLNPLTPTVATRVQLQHRVPDGVKSSFVIFDIRALWRSALSVRVLTLSPERQSAGYQKLQMMT